MPPVAGGLGCPHFTTFDGQEFDFQGAGEFVAVKSTVPGDNFQVQMRIEPEGSADSSVSIITQIAVQVGSDRVTFDASDRNGLVWVDGSPASISASNPVFTLPGGTVTEVSSNDYVVKLNTGESVTVNPFGDGMGFTVTLAQNEGAGSVEGFLGTDSGQANDFTLPDGTVLQEPVTQDELYQTFANAWRVTDATSLFDYGPGQDTETFTNTQYPRDILTLADFPPELVAQAAALVAAAGITDPTLAKDAEFDYITMGNPSYILQDAAVYSENPVPSTPATITQPVAPPPSIGILPATPEVTEASGAATPVTFYVNLTSPASTDTEVNYAVTPDTDYLSNGNGGNNSGKVYFDAADFGGTLPSGSVTIAAGQTEAVVTINVPMSALGSAPAKWLGISVTTPGNNPIYDPTAQTEVVNNQPTAGTPAQPALELLPATASVTSEYAPSLTQSGNAYTLDLGKVLESATLPSLQFALANTAAPTADSLSSVISNYTGAGFEVTGSQPTTPIAAGDAFNDIYVQPSAEPLGEDSETVTFASYDTNDSGYLAQLPNVTLTVEDTVIAPAAATATPSVTFGNVRVGTPESQTITITNSAPSGAANLDVTTTAGARTTASGSIAQLAPGSSDSTDVSVGLDTSAAGLRTGAVTLNLFSDLGNGVEVPALPSPTVTVSGNVYREAAGAVSPSKAIVHVGDPGTEALVVANTDPADGYSEGLIARVVSSSGGISASGGPTGLIAAGASDSSTLTASFSTATAGTVTGDVSVDFETDGTGTSGLGTLDLGTSNVPISITVDNYAQAALEEVSGGGTLQQSGQNYTLNLGSVPEGASPITVSLAVTNTASGPADLLSGAFATSASSAFTPSGFGSFSGLAAGQSESNPTVTFNTNAAGTFTEMITLDPTGSNAGGYSGALAPETLTITGTVLAPIPNPPTVSDASVISGYVNAASDTASQTLGGTAQAGSTVKVYLNGRTTPAYTTTANVTTGAWSVTLGTLADGAYSFTATATDAAGDTSAPSAAYAFTVDTVAPTVSASESVSGLTNKTSDTITVSATAEAVGGDSISGVNIYNGTTLLGAATLSGGVWTYAASLVDGQTYNFSAVATDAAGNSGTATLAAVTAATQPPTVSAVESVSGLTNKTSDTITASATAEAVGGDSISGVNIYNGTTLLGAATLSGGVWTYAASLVDGQTYNFSAVATDAAGNSATATLAAVTAATQPPTVSATESVSGLTNAASDTITVTAAAEGVTGDSISSVVIDNGTTQVGAATLNSTTGQWTYAAPLADGQTYNFSVVTTDTAGNSTTTALAAVTDATQAPTITSATESVSGVTNQTSDTIAVAATAEAVTGDSIASVTIDNGGTALGSATYNSATGAWSYTASGLANGTYTFSAVAKDAAGNTATATLAPVTVDTQTPVVAITSTGGTMTSASQTITGTVTESTESNVVGSTVSLYDNGSTTALGTATVQPGVAGVDGGLPTFTATVMLSLGSNSIVAKDVDLAGNTGTSSPVVYTDTVAAPAITSETYSGGHWVLGGTATAGTTITVYDGSTVLPGTTTATAGMWTFTTAENNSAIRDYTATSTSGTTTSAASAPVYEGTPGNDTFDFPSEMAVSAAALINGGGGTNTLQLTGADVLSDADFAHIEAMQILGLTGASSVTLGADANAAGVKTVVTGAGATSITDTNTGTLTVNAAAISGATLTLAGSTAMAVTTGSGSIAIADTSTGSLTVNAAALGSGSTLTLSGSSVATVTTGTGNITIVDNATGAVTINAAALASGDTLTISGSGAATVTAGANPITIVDNGTGKVTINANALGSGTLTLSGSGPVTVTNLKGTLNAAADTGALSVTANGTSAQGITTGSGNISVADSTTGGSVTVNAAALAAASTLTLSGSAARTVNNLTGTVVASGSGALSVTTGAASAVSVTTGSGTNSINAAAMTTGETLTLKGSTAATLTIGGNLVASSDTGALTVTATGAGAQSVTTGTGSMTITDSTTGGSVSVNANATGAGKTLTLSGSAAETVTNLAENIVATGLSGALNVTTKTTGLSIATGTGGTTVDAGAMTGALTLTGAGAATVTALGGNLAATSETGTLTVTTTGSTQTVTTGTGNLTIVDSSTGAVTVNATAQGSSSTLTLTGSDAVGVTNLKGALNATSDTGAITVTATGTSAQSITTGSGNISIADSATGGLTVNAAALAAASTLTLSGSAARTVTNLTSTLADTGAGALTVTTGAASAISVTTGSGTNSINAAAMTAGETLTLKGSSAATVTVGGNLNASSDTGTLNVTATGAGPQTIQTGSGTDTVIAATGGDTIQVNGKGDSINVSGHTAADSFNYAATSASLNTTAGHDTIAGFAAGGSINDLLGFTALNPSLGIEGQLSAGAKVAADSIAWLYLGGNAMVYVNDSSSALATTSASLMEITLNNVTSGLSATNFRA